MYGSLRYAQNQYAQAVLTYTPIIIPLPIEGNTSYTSLHDSWGGGISIPGLQESAPYSYSISADGFGGESQPAPSQDNFGSGQSSSTYSEQVVGRDTSDYSYARQQDTWGEGITISSPDTIGHYSYAITQDQFGGGIVVNAVSDRDAFGVGKSTAGKTDLFGG